MKYNIFTIILAVLVCLNGCHQPDELIPPVSREGVNSITATFPDGTGEFTGVISEDGNEIIIPIPYYFPVSSTNRIVEDDLTNMRVSANLDDNVVITPSLLYMDLTKDNLITVIDQRKKAKEYIVRGEIRKSSEAQIQEFSLPSLGLSGVIDEEAKTISLIAVDAIDPALAEVTLSYHATISPDPTVEALDYNNEVKLTVTAHDGVTQKVYTVKKAVPDKLPYGIRSGSAKLMFAKQLKADLGIITQKKTQGIAAIGDYIVINTSGENSIYIDAKTGNKIGEIELGTVKNGESNFYTTADDGGNILISNVSPDINGDIVPLKIWKLGSVTSAPELFIEWAGGEEVGRKVSIAGNLESDAIITAPLYGSAQQRIARWTVVGGILTSQTPEIVQMSGLVKGWTSQADAIYTSGSDIESDYYVASYSDNTFAWVDGATNSVHKKLDPISGNFIPNAVDYIEFNNASYVTLNWVNSFTWGSADRVWLLDVSSDANFSGDLNTKTVEAVVWESEANKYGVKAITSGTANTSWGGDVALTVSSNGFYMYLYFMFTDGYIVGYQFDCIDM